MASRNDFYIGYQAHAPRALARFLRLIVLCLLTAAVLAAAVLVGLQGRFDPGVFEFGVVRQLTGVLHTSPHPLLLVDRPGLGDPEPSRYYLVATGKRGADDQVAGLDGRSVRLRGTLIHRQGQTMVEVVPGSVEPLGEAAAMSHGPLDLGSHTLRGEIVDSKCYLGVMKPGRGRPHRACATLCIRGGIPPVLRVETAHGEFRHLLLTDERGGAVNRQVLDLVAEPVEITGRVLRQGELLILQADPAAIRRLGA